MTQIETKSEQNNEFCFVRFLYYYLDFFFVVLIKFSLSRYTNS